ncbi:MAG TPA: hypothetical protein VGQ06_10725 [Gemmatimonadales bacterium]|jgi:hypothetical protein|nr:hypothetical protein [Gemmatimonadales bacterium]
MAQDSRVVSLVLAQFALLLGIAALVDNTLIRTGLDFAVGLLLVQRALGHQPASQAEVTDERRHDPFVRNAVTELLTRIREFYTTCHLMQLQQISPVEATERATKMERNLNHLLAEVVRASRGETGPAPAPIHDVGGGRPL